MANTIEIVIKTSADSKAISNVKKELGGLGVSAQSSSGPIGRLGTTIGSIAKVGAVAIGGLATSIGALSVVSAKTAISFESSFAGVIKTTDGLTSSVGVLNETGEELRKGFVDLSKEIPLAFEELAGIGELGGQLGIGKESLLDFTESVAALGVATNLSTEAAATGLSRISNIFAVDTADMGGNIEQLGSTIVALGNNFATTEADILSFGERMAGAGNIAGLTQADVLSIGAAMSSVGVESEAGGTAVQKVLLSINNAVTGSATGFADYTNEINKNVSKLTDLNAESVRLEAQFPGLQAEMLATKKAFIAGGGAAEDFGRQLGDKTRKKALEVAESIADLESETDLLRKQHGQPIDSKLLSTFAKTARMNVGEFSTLWKEDASEAFRLFVEGLGKEGDNAVNILSELGLEDQRLIRSFLSLSGAGDLLERSLNLGSEAWMENTALAEEAEQRYATTESQLETLKNNFRAVGDAIGRKFLPSLNQGIGLLKDFVSGPLMGLIDALSTGEGLFSALQGLGIPPEFAVQIMDISNAIRGMINGTRDLKGLLMALGLSDKNIKRILDAKNYVHGIIDVVSRGGSIYNVMAAMGFNQEVITTVFKIKQTLDEVFASVQEAVSNLMAGDTSGFLTALGLTPDTATMIIDIGNNIIDTVTNIIASIIAAVTALSAGDTGGFLLAIGLTPEAAATVLTIGEVIKGVFAGIVSALTTAFGTLKGSFGEMTSILNQFGLDWGDVFQALAQATGIVLTGIGALLVGLVGIVAGVFNGIAAVIQSLVDQFQAFWINVEVAIEGAAQIFVGFQKVIDNFGSDWGAVWEGVNQILLGVVEMFSGTFNAILIAVMAPLNAVTDFFVGWIAGIISFAQGLYDSLVGNSIIPDLINGIISWFNMLIEPIQGALDTIGGAISTVFGGIFGLFSGGEGSGEGTNPFAGILTSITTLQDAASTALPEAFTLFFEFLTEQITILIESVLLPFNQLWIDLYTIHFPTLQAVWLTVQAVIVSGLQILIAAMTEFVQQILAAQVAILDLGKISEQVFGDMADDTEEAANAIMNKLIPALDEAIKRLERVEDRATSAANAVANITGQGGGSGQDQYGAAHGMGFQHGSNRLGFLVPPGFPNDSFPINVTSGERVLVSPPGRSIEDIVGGRMSNTVINNNYYFSQTINTSAATTGIDDYRVGLSLIGA